jgi:hypothetical protein
MEAFWNCGAWVNVLDYPDGFLDLVGQYGKPDRLELFAPVDPEDSREFVGPQVYKWTGE